MLVREVSGKVIWCCTLLAESVMECISSPLLAYCRDWCVQKEFSIKYSGISYQYFCVNYITVDGGGLAGQLTCFFFLLHDSKKDPRAEHFFHWIYPTDSPSGWFLRCFELFPIPWGEGSINQAGWGAAPCTLFLRPNSAEKLCCQGTRNIKVGSTPC